MNESYEIIVSSENNVYLAWQTLLFCYSAMSRTHQTPTVIVHRSDEALREEFLLLKELGCSIIEAPSYRNHPQKIYPARNEVGSLLEASNLSYPNRKAILFCEADMVFVRRLMGGSLLSGEYYGYMDYRESRIQHVADRYGIGNQIRLLNREYKIGVPYFIPIEVLERVAKRWLEVLDSFDQILWIDIMYAFGIAIFLEEISFKLTYRMDLNHRPRKDVKGDLIHYCYGDSSWNKRQFSKRSPFHASDIYSRANQSSIEHELMLQLREAKLFFGFSR